MILRFERDSPSPQMVEEMRRVLLVEYMGTAGPAAKRQTPNAGHLPCRP